MEPALALVRRDETVIREVRGCISHAEAGQEQQKAKYTHYMCVCVDNVFHKLDKTSSLDRLEKCYRTDIFKDFVSFCRR